MTRVPPRRQRIVASQGRGRVGKARQHSPSLALLRTSMSYRTSICVFRIVIMIRMIRHMSRRTRRERPIHATFSLSSEDAERIETLRLRLGQMGHLLNRSETVRLALLSLHSQDDAVVDSLLDQLERLRPGRVPRGKAERRQ
jgi:hypothetical protein